jgi:SAM-dependent methyltransferase
VTLGSDASVLFLCEHCCSAQARPPFSEQALHAYYEREYFGDAGWEIRKAKLLARDYVRKVCRYSKFDQNSGPMLEVGAGYGYFAKGMESLTGRAVDVVEPSVACRQSMAALKITGQIAATAGELPFGRRYTEIFCFHVVEHLPSFHDFLKENLDRLAPFGRLWIITPNAAAYSFRKLRQAWGWACPEQHYQFLSSCIPDAFFEAAGGRRVINKDCQPAPIHFPSYWRGRISQGASSLDTKVASTSGPRRLCWRVARKLVALLLDGLSQNRSSWNLSALERLWAGIRQRRPHDELLLVVEKHAIATN